MPGHGGLLVTRSSNNIVKAEKKKRVRVVRSLGSIAGRERWLHIPCTIAVRMVYSREQKQPTLIFVHAGDASSSQVKEKLNHLTC